MEMILIHPRIKGIDTMNRHKLLKEISSMHASKCNKSENFNEAVASFDKLNELKGLVIKTSDNDLQGVVSEIISWAESKPTVTYGKTI